MFSFTILNLKKKDRADLELGEILRNRLYRYELENNKLVNPELLLDVPANLYVPRHNGGKIAIGPDNNVYVIIGNIDHPESKVQNLKGGRNPDGTGAVLRIKQDGKSVEAVLGNEGYLDKYYAYGIRNGFGLSFDPVTGKLWDTENGPDYGDEINPVEPGFNSGWVKYQGVWKSNRTNAEDVVGQNPERLLEDFNGKGKYSPPEFTWNETVGVTDITISNSDKLGKDNENDMFVADFHNGYIYHFDLNKERTELVLNGPLNDKIAKR
jgi:aldose sugar dehydrogenase